MINQSWKKMPRERKREWLVGEVFLFYKQIYLSSKGCRHSLFSSSFVFFIVSSPIIFCIELSFFSLLDDESSPLIIMIFPKSKYFIFWTFGEYLHHCRSDIQLLKKFEEKRFMMTSSLEKI